MKNLKLITLSLLVVCSIQTSAQFGYYQDALRYSQTNYLIGSTARMQGLAGVQVSLGGDMSLTNSNPAGLGFFNKSSATFTLGLGFENSDDEFAGLTTPNFKNIFGVSNAGVVVNYNKGRFSEEKFKGGSIGISVVKVNDFKREYRYEGRSGTSLLDPVLANQNNGTGGYLENAFHNQFLVDQYTYFDTDPMNMDYFPISGGVISPNQAGDFVAWGSPILTNPYQQESILERGGQYQINLSWGGNYDDKLYFGGGLGLQTLYFNRKRSYEENEFIYGDGSPDPLINSFVLKDNLVARGAGLNTSFGLIVRPVQMLTLGVSYQSPTFLTVNEESDFKLTTDWGNFSYEDLNNPNEDMTINTYDLQSDVDPYLSTITNTKYKIKTPAKLNLGATVFLGKLGFISGDVEMVDYKNAEIQSNDFSPLGDNQEILNNYTSVVNYRIGSELRMDNIRFRGGYGLQADPTNNENDRKNITFGLGYKTSDFFIDMAVVNTKFQSLYNPYTFESLDLADPLVTSDHNSTRVTISAGFNF